LVLVGPKLQQETISKETTGLTLYFQPSHQLVVAVVA
jgi:hypothetical protein